MQELWVTVSNTFEVADAVFNTDAVNKLQMTTFVNKRLTDSFKGIGASDPDVNGNVTLQISLDNVLETSSKRVYTQRERDDLVTTVSHVALLRNKLDNVDFRDFAQKGGNRSQEFEVDTDYTKDYCAVNSKVLRSLLTSIEDRITATTGASLHGSTTETFAVADGIAPQHAANLKQVREASTEDRKRSNHTGTQSIDTITETEDLKIMTKDERALLQTLSGSGQNSSAIV